ncbi:MAG: hypothetical protein FWC47_07345 [Oscillospiraceae bacterium]|nr:hypothetical protein [Oscillospiraceae bacterium]
MNEEVGRPELTEEEKESIINIARELGLGTNNGTELKITNPSEEPEYNDSITIEDIVDGTEKFAKKAFVPLNAYKNAQIDLQSIMNFQEGKDNEEIRMNLIKDELKFSKTIEDIDLDKLVEVDSSMNFFALPNNEEFLDLASSVEQYGIINPLIAMRSKESDKYIVLVGRSRLYVLRSLYSESGDMRFFKVPCILLDSSTDPNLIQGLIVSTNMKYRKLSKEDKIKSVLILDDILTKNKKYRSEINVTSVIATKVGISKTTVNNYRELKKLCPLGMELVKNKNMNLGIARMITQKDHETQEKIIKGLGNNINDVRMVKAMMEGPANSIYDAEKKETVKETWEMKTKRTKEMVPPYTYITIKVSPLSVEDTLRDLAVLKKGFAIKYVTTKNKDINRFMQVSVNDKDMVKYINRGFLKQETLDKILATEFNDVIKLA